MTHTNESPGIPGRFILMEVKELERWIARWYYEKWANTPLERLRLSVFTDNRDLGVTPAERYLSRVERDGYPVPLPPHPDDWFMARYERETRVLSNKTGLSVEGFHFKGPNLKRLLSKFGENKVEVLINPDDFRHVLVMTSEGLVTLSNVDTDEYTPAYTYDEAKRLIPQKSATPHPAAAKFDADVSARAAGGGNRKGKRAQSRLSTAIARESAAVSRAGKTKLAASRGHELQTSVAERSQVPAFVEADSLLMVSDRRTGEQL